jgi:hypothetical protein
LRVPQKVSVPFRVTVGLPIAEWIDRKHQRWKISRRAGLQFTIESRELTNEYTHRPAVDVEPRQVIVEAQDPDEAISQFVSENRGELVSLMRPVRGKESIATVKKDDSVFLVRVYAA